MELSLNGDRSILRRVIVPNGVYTERFLFRKVSIPNGNFPDTQVYEVHCIKGQYSEVLIPKVIIPNICYSETLLFRKVIIPKFEIWKHYLSE